MKKCVATILSTLVLSGLSLAAHAVDETDLNQTTGPALTVDEKLADLDVLAQTMRAGYGPLRYKLQAFGVDLNTKVNDYKDRIRATKSNAEFYYLINKFVAEFKDSHFSSRVPSQFGAILPFSTDFIAGKVVIDEVAPTMAGMFPYTRGDEIVSMNGQPIADVLKDVGSHIGSGYDLTNHRISSFFVAYRPGRIVPVPQGAVALGIRRHGAQNVESYKSQWMTVGQPLDEDLKQGLKNIALQRMNSFDTISISDIAAEVKHPRIERTFMCSGSTRIAVPSDATVIMEEPFVAYFHPTPKGNVGYLRIPDYMPMNKVTNQLEFEQRFRQYQYAVSVLEQNTVGLILDQDHNCGGSVNYMHQIISLFAKDPFQPMQFQLRASKTEYLEFNQYAESEVEFTLDKLNIQKVANLLLKTWQAGQFLTVKTSIDGTPAIYPNPVRYTKPIVVLIDELSGSGGDGFPAIMQGIGRAKLLGQRTMGAGGHVQSLPPLPMSGMNVSMTRSLFFRPDGTPVENNGAVPDIPYQITVEDFMSGYQGYQSFYLAKLLELVQ